MKLSREDLLIKIFKFTEGTFRICCQSKRYGIFSDLHYKLEPVIVMANNSVHINAMTLLLSFVTPCSITKIVIISMTECIFFMFPGFSYQEFENFEEIGEGMFSKVFKVKHKRDRHTYALKRSHISIKKQVILDHFTKEVQMISCLVHDNVVRYFTSFVDHKNHFCILMECCRKDLASCFHSKSDMKNMIKPNSVQIFNDIICGLEYIHNQNIIHRDLTPENIFLPSLNDRCHAKIGDFGLSCYHDHSVMSYVGSRRYQAPEQASGKYDCKVDMYPAGIIFFELLKLDWEDPDDQTQSWIMILNNLRSDTKRLMRTFEPFHPKTAKKIILCLLKVNPKARLSATEVRRQLSGSPENECSTFSSTKSRRDSGMCI